MNARKQPRTRPSVRTSPKTSPRERKKDQRRPRAPKQPVDQPIPLQDQPKARRTSIAHPAPAGPVASRPYLLLRQHQRHLKGAPIEATAPRQSGCPGRAIEIQTPQLSDPRNQRPPRPRAVELPPHQQLRVQESLRSPVKPSGTDPGGGRKGRGQVPLPAQEAERRRKRGESAERERASKEEVPIRKERRTEVAKPKSPARPPSPHTPPGPPPAPPSATAPGQEAAREESRASSRTPRPWLDRESALVQPP